MNFHWFKFIFLFAGISLLLTDVTDADLVDKKTLINNHLNATTLNFSNISTINNQDQNLLFDIHGILPNGFAVNTFRLKNTGESNLKYQVTFKFLQGDDQFCQNLNIKLIQDDSVKYQGELTNLNIEIPQIDNSQYNDWVFFISLNSPDLSLKNKQCHFAVDIFGWQPNQLKNTGFNYQRSLINQVSSGDW